MVQGLLHKVILWCRACFTKRLYGAGPASQSDFMVHEPTLWCKGPASPNDFMVQGPTLWCKGPASPNDFMVQGPASQSDFMVQVPASQSDFVVQGLLHKVTLWCMGRLYGARGLLHQMTSWCRCLLHKAVAYRGGGLGCSNPTPEIPKISVESSIA